ncbi:MAG TPA: DUF3180 domain-containing protein [Mycobacteriales bacterium]|nr:DUF3180 domain-containing protein [Mycobacteriales bacterium]
MKPTQPTHPRDLAVIALVAALLSWLVVRQWYGSVPRLQWFVPLSLVVLAVAEAISGFQLRARIRRRPGLEPVDPLVAARQVALAKASALVGAAMVGVWAGLLVYATPRLDRLAAARGDVVTAGVGVVCAGLLVGAALWLEFCCRTPRPPGDSADREDSPHQA